jgi:phage gp29-like protein
MAILDEFGRPIETQPDRLNLSTRDIVASTQDWSSVGSVLGRVTPAAILSTFADADNGYPGRQIELAQDIRERDDHVGSMDQTRRLAVMNMEFIIEPGDEDDALSREAADQFRREWEALGPRDILDGLMDAVLEQWSIRRVVWNTNDAIAGRRHYRPTSVEEVDGRRLAWPQVPTQQPGDITSIIPGIMRDWNPADIDPLVPGKYLWHTYRARTGRPGKGALIRSIAVYWMFKRFALTDVAALLEQYGRPWPSVSYDEKATTADVQAWIDRLAKSMAKRVIALPKGAELKVNDAAATNADTPHFNMFRICNEGISKAIIGSTTIAEAAANNDAVSSPTHAQVRQDIRDADAHAIAASVQRNLAVPWTLWNYGPNVAPPKYSPNTAPKVDPESRGRVYLNGRDLSLRVKSDQLYSELKIEKPDGVPDVLQLQPASTPIPGFGAELLTAPDAPADPEPTGQPVPPVGTEQDVKVTQDAVLNGAQIQAAIDIVKSVTLNEIPRDAGIGQLRVLFNLSGEQAESIMGSAGTPRFVATGGTPVPQV